MFPTNTLENLFHFKYWDFFELITLDWKRKNSSTAFKGQIYKVLKSHFLMKVSGDWKESLDMELQISLSSLISQTKSYNSAIRSSNNESRTQIWVAMAILNQKLDKILEEKENSTKPTLKSLKELKFPRNYDNVVNFGNNSTLSKDSIFDILKSLEKY